MWETWVQSPDWEDPLEKGKVTHSSINWPGGVHGVVKSRTRLSELHFHFLNLSDLTQQTLLFLTWANNPSWVNWDLLFVDLMNSLLPGSSSLTCGKGTGK